MSKTLLDETEEILEKYGIRTKKFLGQNFLIDDHVPKKIIQFLDITKNDLVFEIGSGLGLLTRSLAVKAKKVIAIELDRTLFNVSRSILKDLNNVNLVNEDVLKIDFNKFLTDQSQVKIAANIPYYITTPIIMHILEQRLPFSSKIALLVQKEVGLRIAADPGCKDYGILSIVVQYCAKPEIILHVPRKSFLPSPKVDSVIVGLTILEDPPVKIKNEKVFFELVRASFSHRRKVLANSLIKSSLGVEKEEILKLLSDSGIDPRFRAENLSLQDFANIANNMFERKR